MTLTYRGVHDLGADLYHSSGQADERYSTSNTGGEVGPKLSLFDTVCINPKAVVSE